METRRGRPRRSEAVEQPTVEKVPVKTSKLEPPTSATTRSKMSKSKPLSVYGVILIGMALSLAFLATSIRIYQEYHSQYFKIPRFTNFQERLTFTLQWNAFILIPITFSIFQIIHFRGTTEAIDPLSNNEHFVKCYTNILTNHFEQTVYNFINQLVLISWIPSEQMFVIPLLVMLFVFGRISFMIGYTIRTRYRTFGFVVTFFPSFFIFISNLMFGFGLRNQLPYLGTSSPLAASQKSSN